MIANRVSFSIEMTDKAFITIVYHFSVYIVVYVTIITIMRVLSIFGTRPEAIKMCPLVRELEITKGIESLVCLTGQHREILKQVIDIFGISIDYDLDVMKPNQTLFDLTGNVLSGLEKVFEKEKPDIVLVHGDTTTSFTAALAAFYQKIPVGHVEAGLRTYNKYSPYPEEINRSLVSRIADIHFAPTEVNKKNLAKEGIIKDVFVTGNTVVDAVKTIAEKNAVQKEKRLILVTAHRRENWGEPLKQICHAILQIREKFDDVEFIYPVHPNPEVRKIVNSLLDNQDRVLLTEPLDLREMYTLISKSYLVLTDSGGLQEEVPVFDVPVLVLRTETERPEAVDAGTVKVIGNETEKIVSASSELLENKDAYEKMANAVNPYGDGTASKQIVKYLLEWWDHR